MTTIAKTVLSRLGLPGWIAVGAVGGIATGLFFGEPAGRLSPLGQAYVMLLESVVYPYLMASLIVGLGSLAPADAARLVRRGWPFYLAAWMLVLGGAWLLSLALPSSPPPPVLTDQSALATGFLDLVLPANVFEDLDRNNVPAVVLLSILLGVALQAVPDKSALLGMLTALKAASVRIWNWVVYLAPIAVFAMFAETAGRIRFETLTDLLLYLGLFTGGGFLLAFWALPALVAALAPVSYRELMRDLRPAFVLSLVTTLSVVALPFIQQVAARIASASGVQDKERDDIVATTLAINYPLGQLGNFFVLFFFLFAAYYFHHPIVGMEQILLPVMTLLSCVGSPSSTVAAVDFLGKWLGLPDGALDLYVETMVVTRYAQVALSVAGFAFLTVLITQAYYGRLRVSAWRLLKAGLSTLFVFLLMVLAPLWLAPLQTVREPYDLSQRELAPALTAGLSARVCQPGARCPEANLAPDLLALSSFERIQRTQLLRVGYNPKVAPFSYLNDKGRLVGLDVAMAYELARSLNVRLLFVPFEFPSMRSSLESKRFDIAMAGIFVTPERLLWAEVSHSYHQNPMAMIVRHQGSERFLDMSRLQAGENLSAATFPDPVLEPLLERLLPQANHAVVDSYDQLVGRSDLDAGLWTLEQARTFAAENPSFVAVVPKNLGAIAVFAYYFSPDPGQLKDFVNDWLELKERDGSLNALRDRWLEGGESEPLTPRWSIMRNVLGWGKPSE